MRHVDPNPKFGISGNDNTDEEANATAATSPRGSGFSDRLGMRWCYPPSGQRRREVGTLEAHIIQRGGNNEIPIESERLSPATTDVGIFNCAAATLAWLICASVITAERLFRAAIPRRSPRSTAALYHM